MFVFNAPGAVCHLNNSVPTRISVSVEVIVEVEINRA